MFGVIMWIVLFLFLVLIHELGHFTIAKSTWVKVLEFGMGIPPKVKTLWTDKSGTAYTLNAIPLGWFVRLKWEDPKDEWTFRAKDSFIMASLWAKILVLIAWVAVNFLFAWIVLTWALTIGVKPLVIVPENSSTLVQRSYLTPTVSFLVEKGIIKIYPEQRDTPVVVDEILTWWLASSMGVIPQDAIVSINNEKTDTFTFKKTLKWLIGQDISLMIQRWSQTLTLTGSCPEDNCLMGMTVKDDATVDSLSWLVIKMPFYRAIGAALSEMYTQWSMTLYRLGSFGASLVSFDGDRIGHQVSYFSGPVGAVKFGDMLLTHGWWVQFMVFGAMISFALALFNLLPIPALDGWRILGVLIQSIFFRKRLEKYFTIENYINFFFFVLLMGFGIYIILKDLVVAWGFKIWGIG